tara:strand:+ start:5181 stop:5561 length:381 start_codon:yes stop_codon:yes gene_type:complete
MLVNKCEGRGGVKQIEMTTGEVLQEMIDNWWHDEDTLTGGVEMLDETVCGINIHEQLQYEFNIADLQGKYFMGHVDDCFAQTTKEEWHEELKQRDYDTSWEITEEGILRYMYADGYILIFVYNKKL